LKQAQGADDIYLNQGALAWSETFLKVLGVGCAAVGFSCGILLYLPTNPDPLIAATPREMSIKKLDGSGGFKLTDAAALFSVLACSLWMYRGAFRCFFVQDDFAWLVLSRFHSVGELLACFVRFNPAGTYRPLSQEAYFWLGQTIFGMWPTGFHIIGCATHLTAVALLYLLLRRFFDTVPALTGAFCYAVHGAHVTSLYWISAFPEPLAMVFYLAAVLAFIHFVRTNSRYAYLLSVIAMLLGIMSKESILSLPLILAAYCAWLARSRFLWTLPHFLVSGAYMLLRVSGRVQIAPYDLSLGRQTLASLASYLSWMAGFIGNPMPSSWGLDVVRHYSWIGAGVVVAVMILFLLARVRPIAGFAILWILFALQPVLYFSNHSYPYYLAPALAGMTLLIASALPPWQKPIGWKCWLPALLVAGAISWLSAGTIRADGNWWNQRSASRHGFIAELLDINRRVPDGETAFIFGLKQDDFDKLEGGAVLKAYRLSGRKLRFVLPELDSGLAASLEQLVQTGGIRQVHCFRFLSGKAVDLTSEFRSDPWKYLEPKPVSFLEVPGVRIEAGPAIIHRGTDTLVVKVINLDAHTVDLLYSIDGQLMPPALQWRLDAQHTARVFADMTTPEGEYRFEAVRPAGTANSSWIKINAHLTVR
jgi:hypothetical protein